MTSRNSNNGKLLVTMLTLDEKLNLPQICLVQICCKYEICKALQPVQKVAMAEFAQKQANSAIATLALGAKLCKAHTSNIFLHKANLMQIRFLSCVRLWKSFLFQDRVTL